MRESDEIERLRSEIRAARLNVAGLQRRIQLLERQVAAERASAALFAQQVRELRHSRSWQVTAPLRIVMRRVRG